MLLSLKRFIRIDYKIKYAFFIFLIITCASFAQDKIENESLKSLLQEGEIAPSNSLKDTSGKEISFPEANKWNLIFYWSLFCHSCIEEMPEIQSGLESLEGKDFSTYFISLDTEKMQKALINFKKRRKFSPTILMERLENEKYISADSWGVTMTPSVFIVNPEGKIVFSHQGPIDLDLFFKNLPEEIAGKKLNDDLIESSKGESNEQ